MAQTLKGIAFFKLGGYIGIVEKKMETTTMGYIRSIGYILGSYWDNAKNGNYYLAFRV